MPISGTNAVTDYDYMIEDDEFFALYDMVSHRYSQKMADFLLFLRLMGMRCIEVCFINVEDFFRKNNLWYLRYRCAKTKVVLERPVPEYLMQRIFKRVKDNPLILAHYAGFLFHRHNGTMFKGCPVMKPTTMGAFMGKWRKILINGWKGRKWPEFAHKNDHWNFYCTECNLKWNQKEKTELGIGEFCTDCGFLLVKKNFHIHRIHLHSIRHAYQTQAIDHDANIFFIKRLMGYGDLETAAAYVSKRAMDKKIPVFVKESINPFVEAILNYDPNQKSLFAFVDT